MHPILFLKNVAPLPVFGPSVWVLAPPAAKSCRRAFQEQHRKKQITQPYTQREKSSSVKVTGICTRGKIKFAVKSGLRANLECEASTPFTQTYAAIRLSL